MSCLTEEQLDALAAGELPDSVAMPLRAHMEECQACREIFKECQDNRALVAQIKGVPANMGGGGDSIGPISVRSSALDSLDGDSSPLPPFDSIPGYRIVREIHRGGQGVVYQAIQESTRRKVAIKVLLEGPFAGERSRWRFEREVKLTAALRHPNIVSIHDSGIAHGRHYFAMDYVRGLPLDEYVRFKALGARDIVRLFSQVCEAISYAHRRGVIHRDLKPSNVLVSDDGAPYVVDFGLAKVTSVGAARSQTVLASQSGHLLGTLRYMSPEQTVGDPDAIDTRTDVYSLGVMLYELVTDAVPYNTRCDLETALRNIRQADPPRPSRLRKGVKSEIDAIVLRAMEKDPRRRYQSANEMAQDLTAWLEGRPVFARSNSSLYVLRKLAARHYFHTSVIAALVASMIAFGSISYQAYLRSDRALQEKTLSEKSLKGALQDMSKFKGEASERVRQQALGWFLLEWHAGRLDRAQAIRAQLKHEDSGEYLAMSYLLNDGVSAEDLRRRLPATAASLVHFVIGEELLKAGKIPEAVGEFEVAVRESQDRNDWYAQSAAARLERLRALTTGPAEGASSRPARESGTP